MCFDIIRRYKPQQIWFRFYPNTKPVPYEASDAVVPVQFDFYIKTQCLLNRYLFSDSRRRHIGYYIPVPTSRD